MTGSNQHSREVKATFNRLATGLIAVKGHLDEPYPDDPRWTPWERFVEKEIRDHGEALDGLIEQLESAQRERDSWEKVAREYETALADRGAL